MNKFPLKRLLHGGDYNPEQWPRETWLEDARLMDIAQMNSATVGVFSWVSLEPEEGKYTFDWLDEIMDLLAKHDRAVFLATPSAAPPAWLSKQYPETLRTGPDRVRRGHGNRVNYCLTSPKYRDLTRGMASKLAERYRNHPALALWHVSNEYGGECHCVLCAAAFRDWLRAKFEGDLDRLNTAYWTAFWGHTYTDWEQIEIPGQPYGESAIHGLTLDWRRFVSGQTISLYLNEANVLRAATPNIPVTTNFMGFYPGLNYWDFAKHVDIATWDSYPGFAGVLTDPSTWISAALAHDLTRSLKPGRNFLLMECTPSASNWYPEMELKRPGLHALEGLQAIAHGSDSVQYFQWRNSRGGQEKFHGAVVGHDGTDRSRVFKEVAALGDTLSQLDAVAGTTTKSEVAIVFDWENQWAMDDSCGPVVGNKKYVETIKQHYAPFWDAGISVDIVPPNGDFSSYRLVIAPMLYMVKPGVAERMKRFVQAGGTFVTTYLTGIVDENDLVFNGGFPGPLRELLGIWSEEIDALRNGRTNHLAFVEDNALGAIGSFEAHLLCDIVHAETADVLAKYTTDFYAQQPAVTVNRYGEGQAYYIASRNDAAFQTEFFGRLIDELAIARAIDAELPNGVTARRRGEFVFILNCTPNPQTVVIRESGLVDALSIESVHGEIAIDKFGTLVLRSQP